MKSRDSLVVLIGDLVASRTDPDRQELHHRLERALADADARVTPVDPAVVTVGDEFQGVYATLGDAVITGFRVRLALLPDADIRFGIGRGEVRTLDVGRGIHDGSAYWRARDAIEASEARAGHARTRSARTTYLSPDDPPHRVETVQASLDCLDFMVGSLTSPSPAILEGLMNGHPQLEIARQTGISPSAVSQRLRRDGLGVALDALTTLAGLP